MTVKLRLPGSEDIVIIVVYMYCIMVLMTVMLQSVLYGHKPFQHLLVVRFLSTWWQRCEEERCILLACSGSTTVRARSQVSGDQG